MTFDRLSMVHIAAVVSWTISWTVSWTIGQGCYDLTPVPASDAGFCPADKTVAYGCAPQDAGDAGDTEDAGGVDAPAGDGADEPTE